jgi:hypothetical protein
LLVAEGILAVFPDDVDHPSAISHNKVSPICDPTAVAQEERDALVSPASNNTVAPIINCF